MKYPEVYKAIRAALQRDVAEGILRADRLDACVELTYKKRARGIKLGLRTEEETIQDFA